MGYKKKIFLILSVFFSLIVISCLSNQNKITNSLTNEDYNFDKFKDKYKDSHYINMSLGLTMRFDNNWDIQTKYENFENLSKKYAQIIVSKNGEVLFVGFNKERNMGVRAICEIRDLSNDEYIKKIKSAINKDISDYKVRFILEKKESYEYIEGIHIIAEATINSANKFIFDSIVFNKKNARFKIDFWCQNDIHEREKKYIKDIFNTINISGDVSSDILIETQDVTFDSGLY